MYHLKYWQFPLPVLSSKSSSSLSKSHTAALKKLSMLRYNRGPVPSLNPKRQDRTAHYNHKMEAQIQTTLLFSVITSIFVLM